MALAMRTAIITGRMWVICPVSSKIINITTDYDHLGLWLLCF